MEIAEIDWEAGSPQYGEIVRRYIPGAAVDERVAYIQHLSNGVTLRDHYHADRLGNVIALAAHGSGEQRAHYVYTPFGVETPWDLTGQPYRYTGRRTDRHTGLYYYRARYYDPALGRFLQADPIGYADQMNLYAYVGNNPLNATDPSGLQAVPVTGPIPAPIPPQAIPGTEANRQHLENSQRLAAEAEQYFSDVGRGAQIILDRAYQSVSGGDGSDDWRNTGAPPPAGHNGPPEPEKPSGPQLPPPAWPPNPDQIMHIFSGGDGHFSQDTPGNRQLIEETISAEYLVNGDAYGNNWYGRVLGSRLIHSQKATRMARATADRKFLASLS